MRVLIEEGNLQRAQRRRGAQGYPRVGKHSVNRIPGSHEEHPREDEHHHSTDLVLDGKDERNIAGFPRGVAKVVQLRKVSLAFGKRSHNNRRSASVSFDRVSSCTGRGIEAGQRTRTRAGSP